jgi:hypothetical protein
MKKIKLFEDFPAKKESGIRSKFTEKDYYNILDLFQEYADDYRMAELVKGNTRTSDFYIDRHRKHKKSLASVMNLT